jgi:TfoX/Sxy family transcriptional regulator of competence genes
MAYDEELADLMREALAGTRGVTEKRMFGGLAFLVAGHLAVAASGQGGALVRVDPARSDDLLESTAAELAVMRGRPMQGWLRVGPEALTDPDQVRFWTGIGAQHAASLPPKSR